MSVAPAAGEPWLLSAATIVTTTLVAAVAAGVLALVAASCRPELRAILHAAAANVCFGATAMIAFALALLPTDLKGVLLAGAAAAALVVVGERCRGGGLGGCLATLTLVDPLVALVIGMVVVGERLIGWVGAVALAAAGALAVAGGLVALVRAGPTHVPAPAALPPRRPAGLGDEGRERRVHCAS